MAASRFRPVAASLAVVALAGLGLVLGGGGAQGSVATHAVASVQYASIYVNYTDQCTFTMSNDAGAPITTIPPGMYTVVVITPTIFRNLYDAGQTSNNLNACGGFVQFQLTGPGVNLATTLDSGCQNQLTLPATNFPKSSTFTALDNNNPAATKTTFTTAATGSPQVPTSGGQPTLTTSTTQDIQTILGEKIPPTRHFAALLGANGATTFLSPAGKNALNAPQGEVAITVKDLDPKATFVIQQNGSPPIRLTPAKFVGTKVRVVRFVPGIWKYYASPRGAVHTFLVIG